MFAGATGCYGFGSGDDSDPNTSTTPTGLVCDPSAKPPVATLRRLTTAQYLATVRDLTTWMLGDAKASDGVIAATSSITNLPPDEREKTPEDVHGSYRRLDQTLQAARVEAYYQIGVDLGHALTTSANLGKVVGACATDSNTQNDAACIDAFVRKVGSRILRRPITDAEVAFYKNVYGASTVQDPDAYADVLGVMLNAPDFLYFVEHGTSGVDGDANDLWLGPYELASRLSYQLWDTMPDDALFAAAADGSLVTDAGYQKQVDRMFADPKTRATMDGFFRDWIKADDLPALDLRNDDPLFKSFAGANLPSKTLKDAMIADAVDTIDYVVWTQKAGLSELLSTEANVNRDPELAKIYGVPVWDGKGTPPDFGGARPGLLTRAMFLSTGSATTRPIMKGAFIRKYLLCDSISPPPANAKLTTPDLRPDMTTREVVEELTEKQGTACAGCHQYQINPLGFTTEGFDSLGRARTAQTLFDATGKVAGQKPVHVDTFPNVQLGDMRPSASPKETMDQIAASPKTSACLSRNYFRFTAGRWETTGDGCTIKKYDDALRAGSIADVLRMAVMDPRFRQRMFDAK